MKKILLAIPGNSTFYKPSVLTFRELGWNVRNVDYRKTDISAGVKNYLNLPKTIIREISTNKRPSIKRAINNNEILRIAKIWKPDVFLTFKGEIILPETTNKLKTLGIKTVNWYPDHLADTKANSDFIKSYTCFVYWDGWRTKKYHKKGLKNVLYLPFCTTAEKTPAPKNKKYKVNFVSTWHKHREDKVAPLSNFGLKIWGNKNWEKSNLVKNYQWGPVKVEEMIKVFRQSKITLNVHSVEKIYSEGTNVRTFEATGANAFLLSNRRKCLYELFKVGKELEVFDSDEELIEKTKFYLKNDSLREKIAKAGWERTKKDHTYLNRFSALLKYLNI